MKEHRFKVSFDKGEEWVIVKANNLDEAVILAKAERIKLDKDYTIEGTLLMDLIPRVINKKECFSCQVNFTVEDQNDRPEGYFCDNCIDNQPANNIHRHKGNEQ